MTKYIAGLLLLAFVSTAGAQTKPAAKTSTPPKKATAAVVLKPEKEGAFCPEFKKVLDAAKDNFDAIKGDTIRKTKSIIIASNVSLPGLSANRISHDKSINQTFYRAFLEGTGNLATVKSKFEGIKSKIKGCLPKAYVEKNKESETKTDYTRLLVLSEKAQDSKTKEYSGMVIEIETEYDVAAAADYDISITITYYK